MPQATTTVLKAAQMPAAENSNYFVNLSELPNVCPVCHVTIAPDYLTGTPFCAAFDWVEAFFRCTNMRCRRQFTAFYRRGGGNTSSGLPNFELHSCTPLTPMAPVFDPVVNELSPNFVRIYAQSSAAEGYGLDDIAGPGFRKALEFLIKDYAIQLSPGHDDEIKRMQLADVIAEFLPGDKLTVVSSRAAWLGNDETHYERRWVDKDLQDLKKLISASVHFIAMERLAADLPTEMPPTGPTTPTIT
jgi:hypothetical protein